MKYKFNDSSLAIGYVKEFLHNFNCPSLSTNTKTIIDGRRYISNDHICLAKNNKLIQLQPYIWGASYVNMTTTLDINSSIYDFDTHRQLGNYLRVLRDVKNINLMPLYNCFMPLQPASTLFSLQLANNKVITINTRDKDYVYYLVPARLNETYTVAIESMAQYEMMTMVYTGSTVNFKELITKTYKKVCGSQFKKPFTYTTTCSSDLLSDVWRQEENVHILLKIPKSVKTSIVILEGDYTYMSTTFGIVTKVHYNQDFTSDFALKPYTKLSLLNISDGISYPFADRLIEYLLGNAIDTNDQISENIQRVQDALYSQRPLKGISGIFGLDARLSIIAEAQKDRYKPMGTLKAYNNNPDAPAWENFNMLRSLVDRQPDVLYYVDKDIEEVIGSE